MVISKLPNSLNLGQRGEGNKKVLIGTGINAFPSLGILSCTSMMGCVFLTLAAPVLGRPLHTESAGSLLASCVLWEWFKYLQTARRWACALCYVPWAVSQQHSHIRNGGEIPNQRATNEIFNKMEVVYQVKCLFPMYIVRDCFIALHALWRVKGFGWLGQLRREDL